MMLKGSQNLRKLLERNGFRTDWEVYGEVDIDAQVAILVFECRGCTT